MGLTTPIARAIVRRIVRSEGWFEVMTWAAGDTIKFVAARPDCTPAKIVYERPVSGYRLHGVRALGTEGWLGQVATHFAKRKPGAAHDALPPSEQSAP